MKTVCFITDMAGSCIPTKVNWHEHALTVTCSLHCLQKKFWMILILDKKVSDNNHREQKLVIIILNDILMTHSSFSNS